MRKRNHSMLVFYTDAEYEALKAKAAAAGISCSEFVRRAVDGQKVKQAPPADIPILIRDIRRVGYNVEQLLKIANSTHLLDAPQMRQTLIRVHLAADKILKAYTTED